MQIYFKKIYILHVHVYSLSWKLYMGSFVHCNLQYLYFLMLLFMNHCNDFAPCGPSIGQ